MYERFYLRFSDVEKGDIRAAFQRASETALPGAPDESEFADRYKYVKVDFDRTVKGDKQ